LLTACTSPPGPAHPVMKCPTIPPPRAPTTPTQAESGANLVLAPGHWDWADNSYAWVPPAWVNRPHPEAEKSGRIWQNGSWSSAGIACVWVPGHFLF